MYSLGEIIGEGSDGKVFSLKEDGKETNFAMKFVDNKGRGMKNFLEAYILLNLKHQNLASAEEIQNCPNDMKIKQEKAVMDLHNFLNRKRVSKKDKYRICLEIAKGIAYLHSFGIIHGDIKPSNVLVYTNPDKERKDARDVRDAKNGKKQGTYRFKVTDFSLSVLSGVITEKDKIKRFYTKEYKSPEVREGRRISLKSDIWALGCTFYEIFYETVYTEGAIVEEEYLDYILSNMLCEEDKRWDINKVCLEALNCSDCKPISPKILSREEHEKNLIHLSDEIGIVDKSVFLMKSLDLYSGECEKEEEREDESEDENGKYEKDESLIGKLGWKIYSYLYV